MNIDKLNNWLTLFANVGVLAGIVFLALELSQNNALMESQARFNRLDVGRSGVETALNNYPSAWGAAIWKDRAELSSEEEIALTMWWSNTFQGWDWTFKEIPESELPVERWRRGISLTMALEIWELRKFDFDEEFVNFINQNVIQN